MNRLFLFLACLVLPSTALAQGPIVTSTAFVHVNVAPMETARVLMDQTVLVEGGVITAMGAGLTPPPGARVIDGHRRSFLSPGLADMHSHSDTSEDMRIYLANGVTSILNMGGASTSFVDQVRPSVNSGQRPGPHVYVSLRVDGTPRYGQFVVTTVDEARWTVRLAKTNGYDFIKVYNNLTPEVFAALAREGQAQHMPLVGHGVTAVGLEKQLEAGQVLVAHSEEFLYAFFRTDDDQGTPSDDQIPEALALLLRTGAFVTADLETYATIARQWGRPDLGAAFMGSPLFQTLAPAWRLDWTKQDYAMRKGSLDARLAFLTRFTKAMSDAGVQLVAGTDAPSIPGMFPGVSLHDDLDALQAAGLTRYQALSAATRTPGRLIARAQPTAAPFGVIKPGARADLVLSANNPLDDLATLRRPLGVMANGVWYDAKSLQAMADEVAQSYARIARPPTINRGPSPPNRP